MALCARALALRLAVLTSIEDIVPTFVTLPMSMSMSMSVTVSISVFAPVTVPVPVFVIAPVTVPVPMLVPVTVTVAVACRCCVWQHGGSFKGVMSSEVAGNVERFCCQCRHKLCDANGHGWHEAWFDYGIRSDRIAKHRAGWRRAYA